MKKDSIWNKRIEIKYEKEWMILICVMIFRVFGTYLYDLTELIPTLLWTSRVSFLISLLLTVPVFVVFMKYGIASRDKIFIKGGKQFLWIPVLYVLYWIADYLIVLIPNGEDLVPDFSDIVLYHLTFVEIIKVLWSYFFVALFEDFAFRVYLQSELTVFMGKKSFLAPIVAGIIFGLDHYPQGGLQAAFFAGTAGMLIGYAWLYGKNCSFVSLVLAHMLYDSSVIFVERIVPVQWIN